jgi:hypothetical protein
MNSERGVLSYPIPPYANLPIEPQFYLPDEFVVSAISLGPTTIITTTVNMNFVIGQLVRLIIPGQFGSYQLNGKEAYVISIPMPNQVELELNSISNVDAFVSSTYMIQQPQIIAVGDVNNGSINSNGRTNTITYIPGSFINISPM